MLEENNEVQETQEPQEQAEQKEQQPILDNQEPELGDNEYLLIDGIKGEGERPEWFKGDKYKSVAEQARAYTELEKKFGSFTGAPKDGYEMPEGIDSEDALVQEVVKFGEESNLNQEGFSKLLDLAMTQAQVTEEVNREQELQKLGDNAGQRIKQVETWLKHKMGESYSEVQELVTSADDVLLVEKIMNQVNPKPLPLEGGDPVDGMTWADAEAMLLEKDQHGNLKMSVDREHKRKYDELVKKLGGDKPYKRIVG